MRKLLKEKRIESNLTQSKIASLIGLSRSQYAKIEGGSRNLSFDTSKRIKNVLRYDKDDLFENKEICVAKEEAN